MRYVLDTSVALTWVLKEPLSAKAAILRDEYRRGIHQLIAPDTIVAEASHALTKAERKKIIAIGDSATLLADLLSTPPRLFSFLALVQRAVEISSKSRVGFYDSLFVALAEQDGCELLTADAKLVKALPGYPIRDFSTLP